MPIAYHNDWNYPIERLSQISNFGLQKDYEIIQELSTDILGELKIIKHKNQTVWIIGEFNSENNFNVYLRIDLDVENIRGQKLGYGKLYQVRKISVKEEYRFYSLATFIYQWLINNYDFVIMGDREQYFGARKLWAKLSQATDVQVDIVNLNEWKIISENVILHQGNYDEDFDKEIWSYDVEKEHIRLVLKKVL